MDLYLVHWPVESKYEDAWRTLETLYKQGKVKAIGVSNFQIHHLEKLMKHAEIKPTVNQVEFHPRLTQKELLAYCQSQDIQLEAWSPLMQGKLLNNPDCLRLQNDTTKRLPKLLLDGICKVV